MRTRLFGVGALVIIALSASGPAHASDSIPFAITGTVQSTAVPDAACRGLHNSDVGKVMGTPLGQMTFKNSECIDFVDTPGSVYIRDAVFSLTNRHGTLSGTYTARGGLPNSRLHVYVWGPLRITKGTGRYRGVTGTGLVAAEADLTTNQVHLELTGRLNT